MAKENILKTKIENLNRKMENVFKIQIKTLELKNFLKIQWRSIIR